MNDNKSLIDTEKQSFWDKIFCSIKKTFSKDNKDINIINENKPKLNSDEYFDNIDILDIQQKYEEGKISLGELTDEEIDKLNDLYDTQLNMLKNLWKNKEIELINLSKKGKI